MNDAPDPSARRALVVRALTTLAAVAVWWLVAGDSMPAVLDAVARISAPTFLAAVLLGLANNALGAARFRTLLRAYGARLVPSLARALVLYLVGGFFNTALPGNVAGDLLRGRYVERALPGVGVYVVVLVERVLGLAGLLIVAASAALASGRTNGPFLGLVAVFGVASAITLASAPLLAHRLGTRFGGRLEALAAKLPRVRHPARIAAALAYSVLTQVLSAFVAFILLASVAPEVRLVDALAVLPLTLLALYLPTIAGIGARELAFVALLTPLGVGEGEATAASLGLLATQLAIASVGGVVHLVTRRTPPVP